MKTAETGDFVRTGGAENQAGASVRAFIAIELPENIIAVLDRLQEQLKSLRLPLRWTRPENIHLTLKFLGDIPGSVLSTVGDAVFETARAHGPFALSARGIGVFPGIQRPNVIWTGIGGKTEALAFLQRGLDVRIQDLLGIAMEKRRFTGHLTLGRVKGKADPKRFIDVMEKFGGLETDMFTVDAVCLFSSRLLPSGPVYTRVMKASLGS